MKVDVLALGMLTCVANPARRLARADLSAVTGGEKIVCR